MKRSDINIITDILAEAEKRIERHLRRRHDYSEDAVEDVFDEVESGLYDLIKRLRTQHVSERDVGLYYSFKDQ